MRKISLVTNASGLPIIGAPGSSIAPVVSSVSAAETSGARFADQEGSTHTTVTVTPSFSGTPIYPCSVSIFLNQGSGYVFSGTFQITGVGGTAILGAHSIGNTGNPQDNGIWVPTTSGSSTWNVACVGGIYTGPAVPTTLPTGSQTCSFSISPVGACPATDVTSASFLTTGGNQMIYGLTGPGVYTWNFYEMQMTLPSSDPAFWFCAFTVQKGWNNSGTWVPAPDYEGVERQFSDSGAVTGTNGPTGATFTLNGGTSLVNGVVVPNWTFPLVTNPDGSTNNYRTFRFRVYAYSKQGTSTAGGNGTATLQTCWPGSADHYDLTPTSQPAALDLTMSNPTTLGNGLNKDGSNRLQVNAGSGVTTASGQVALNYGAALADDGSGKATVKVAGPLYKDVSNNLNLSIASDFVVSGGTLNQNFVNLAKSVNYDTEFTISGGTLAINSIAVNKLSAGTALFAGTATFASTSGPEVQIGSSGITIADNYSSPQNTVTISSGGVSLAHGSNQVQVTSGGVYIYGPSGSLTATSGGLAITNGSSSVSITPSSVSIVNGSLSSPSISGGTITSTTLNSATISSPSISAGSITGTSISITSSFSGITNTVSIATSTPDIITISSSNGYTTYFNASTLSQYGGSTGGSQFTPGEVYLSNSTQYCYVLPYEVAIYNSSGQSAYISPTSITTTGALMISGWTAINSSAQFVGPGVNVGQYDGVSGRAFNPYDSGGTLWTGADATVYFSGGFSYNGTSYHTLQFVGGILVRAY